MRIAGTIHSTLRRFPRRWSALRGRLQRRRAVASLALLLVLGLGEPLLCIVHCQIWLPIALRSYFAAQHSHAHHAGHARSAAASGGFTIQNVPAAARASLGQTDLPGCALQSGASDSSAPLHVPLSPVHDMIPALGLALLVSLAVALWSAHPAGDPPRTFHRLPLRPPIALAA